MAKTKKTSKNDVSKGAEASVNKVTAKKAENKTKKATKTVGKVTKPKPAGVAAQQSPRSKNPPIAEIIRVTLTTLQNRQGSSLAAIRNFIASNYDLEMTKGRQTAIRKAMTKEFEEGRIRMTNADKETIDLTKRFNVA